MKGMKTWVKENSFFVVVMIAVMVFAVVIFTLREAYDRNEKLCASEKEAAIESLADLRGQVKMIYTLYLEGEEIEVLESRLEDVITNFEETKTLNPNKYLNLKLEPSITSSIQDGICVEYIAQIDSEIQRLKSE